MSLSALPILILFPHSRCNCRCLMCDIWKVKESREISREDVARWLPEWQGLGVSRVVLSGGEPLLHSHLWELCRVLRDAGIGITLLSSGLLLGRNADGIAQHVDDLIVSLDGPREVHDAIRNVPRAFDRLAEGIQAVRRARQEIPISARCTVQRRNAGSLVATVQASRSLGLDHISFLAADVTSKGDGVFNRDGQDRPEILDLALRPEDLETLANELSRLERDHTGDFRSGFLAESPQKLWSTLYVHFRAVLGLDRFPARTCNAPWVSAVVESDGTVRPCFFHKPIGNVFASGSLEAVLYSPPARHFRETLDIASDPTCQACVCSLNLKDDDPRGLASPKSAIHAGVEEPSLVSR